MARRRDKTLLKWEVALVKAMLEKNSPPQDIHAYFTRPSRSINQTRILDIRDEKKHRSVKPASKDELDLFILSWPNIDPESGLHRRGDILLTKAREAMIAAVHTFNGAGIYFRAELFIVTAMIAWTYLLHAYFKREGIDYRYKKDGEVVQTPNGEDRYWDLSKCLQHQRIPLENGMVNNLKFLIAIRHEIEHQMTEKIDDAISAKLQACCLNFNDTLIETFGREFSLEKHLSIALQFVTFDGAQRENLIGADLPEHIRITMESFHETLTETEQKDPRFRYSVAFVQKSASKASNADLAIEFVKAGTPEADEVDRVLLKETEKTKYSATEIIRKITEAGHQNFNMHDHSLLARQLEARNKNKGFGVQLPNNWYWYEKWFEKIIEKIDEGWTRRG